MKIAQRDYLLYLNDIARDAAKERVKILENEHKVKTSADDEEKYYRAYLQKLRKLYPYSENDEFFNRFTTLKNTASSNIARWLMGGGSGSNNEEFNPDNIAKKAELEKFLPLLAGIAEPGKDWLSVGGEALLNKAASSDYNYPREEFPAFLEKLRQYQTDYDRAKLWEEYKKKSGDVNYTIDKLLYPSAMQELENSVLTGQGDEETVNQLANMDKRMNMATVVAPSLVGAGKYVPGVARVVANPYGNAAAGTLLQMAMEAERQSEKENLSQTGQEFDVAPVIGTGVASATVPTGATMLAQTMGKVPVAGARKFARGIQKGVRLGDPLVDEEVAISPTVELFNKLYKDPKFANLNDEVELYRIANKALANSNLKVTPGDHGVIQDNLWASINKPGDLGLTASEFNKLAEDQARAYDIIGNVVQGQKYPIVGAKMGSNNNAFATLLKGDKYKRLYPDIKNADGTIDAKKLMEHYNSPIHANYEYYTGGNPEPITDIPFRYGVKEMPRNISWLDKAKAGVAERIANKLPDNSKYKDKLLEYAVDMLEPTDTGRAYARNQLYMGPSEQLFKDVFPEKYADIMGSNATLRAGETLGNIANIAGGRIEPTVKVDPRDLINGREVREPDYKEQKWYKDLVKKNPDAKKILDAAFKKKQEDDEEE